MADLFTFPVQCTCPTCGRPCGEDELAECARCGQQYCKRDSWECECDRTARELLSRAEHPRSSILDMFRSLLHRN